MIRNPFENNKGYKIIESVAFDEKRGVVLANNPQAAFPMTVFQYAVENGKREYFGGQYFLAINSELAKADFNDRIDAYKHENPTATVKYNALASAEMSGEDNYNSIDGIANNGFKPSILGHIRELEHKVAENATGKDARPPDFAR